MMECWGKESYPRPPARRPGRKVGHVPREGDRQCCQPWERCCEHLQAPLPGVGAGAWHLHPEMEQQIWAAVAGAGTNLSTTEGVASAEAEGRDSHCEPLGMWPWAGTQRGGCLANESSSTDPSPARLPLHLGCGNHGDGDPE